MKTHWYVQVYRVLYAINKLEAEVVNGDEGVVSLFIE